MNWARPVRRALMDIPGAAPTLEMVVLPEDADARSRVSLLADTLKNLDADRQWFLVGIGKPDTDSAQSTDATTADAVAAKPTGVSQLAEFVKSIEKMIDSRDFGQAERSIQQRLETGLVNPSLIYLLSSVQVQLGKRTEARDNLGLLLRLKPDHERGRALLKKLEL